MILKIIGIIVIIFIVLAIIGTIMEKVEEKKEQKEEEEYEKFLQTPEGQKQHEEEQRRAEIRQQKMQERQAKASEERSEFLNSLEKDCFTAVPLLRDKYEHLTISGVKSIPLIDDATGKLKVVSWKLLRDIQNSNSFAFSGYVSHKIVVLNDVLQNIELDERYNTIKLRVGNDKYDSVCCFMDEDEQDKSVFARLCAGNEVAIIGVMLEPKDYQYTMNSCILFGYGGNIEESVKQKVIDIYDKKVKEELERAKYQDMLCT